MRAMCRTHVPRSWVQGQGHTGRCTHRIVPLLVLVATIFAVSQRDMAMAGSDGETDRQTDRRTDPTATITGPQYYWKAIKT